MRRPTLATTFAGMAGAAICAAAASLIAAPDASAYSARVRDACAGDYLRFCPHYPEGSPKLRGCMRSHGRSLTPSCISALMDAGLVSKKDMKRR